MNYRRQNQALILVALSPCVWENDYSKLERVIRDDISEKLDVIKGLPSAERKHRLWDRLWTPTLDIRTSNHDLEVVADFVHRGLTMLGSGSLSKLS